MDAINTKVTGNTLLASEWNQPMSEILNIFEAYGITPSNVDLNQLGKALSNKATTGDFFTDSGVVNAYVLSSLTTNQNPTGLTAGMRVRFFTSNPNTSAATVNVTATGVKNISSTYGSLTPLVTGDMGDYNELVYDGTRFYLDISVVVNSRLAEDNAQRIKDMIMRNWSRWASTDATTDWKAVAFSPSLNVYAMLGVFGTSFSNYSYDGRKWVNGGTVAANSWKGMCWAEGLGLFVAVSSDGTNRVITSTTGISWTTRTAASATNWSGVAWSESLALLVAVSTGSTNAVMTSTDGTTWTSRNAATSEQWTTIVWAEELSLFVSTAQTGIDCVMTSPDGITWTTRTGAEANDWRGLAWSPELGLLAAVAPSGATYQIMTSSDGITWTGRVPPSSKFYHAIAWSPALGAFVAVSYGTGSGFESLKSTDGITWENFTIGGGQGLLSWNAIIWSTEMGRFLAVGGASSYPVSTSL